MYMYVCMYVCTLYVHVCNYVCIYMYIVVLHVCTCKYMYILCTTCMCVCTVKSPLTDTPCNGHLVFNGRNQCTDSYYCRNGLSI